MDILFITANLPYPPTDGWKIRVFSLIAQLGRRHRVSVASFLRTTEDPRAVKELQRYCSEVRVVPRDPRYSRWKLLQGLLQRDPFSVINYRDVRMTALVREMLRERRFDIIQAECLQMAQYALDLQGRSVLDLHNIESSLMRRYAQQERHPLKSAYAAITAKKLAEYERAVCGRFAECVTCSIEDARLLRELTGTTHVQVIPNGVDTEAHAPSDEEEVVPNRLVFVGRMDYHANVDGVRWFCTDVLPRIHVERPDVVFQIVGSHPTREVQRLARDPRIEITGFVDDVRPYVRAAAVVVIPLRVGGGTRLKLMEALAMGKAVVSTRLGAEGVAISSGTDALLADDALDLAQQTLHLLERPLLSRRLGEAGRRLVEDRYSWQMIAEQLERIYLERARPAVVREETFAPVPSLTRTGNM